MPDTRLRYVKVAVNAGRPHHMTFTYSAPAERSVERGEVVHVPWGARTLQGVVVEGPFDTPGYDREAIRPLEPELEGAPRIGAERLALAAWMRDYYLAPPWEAYAVMLPPGAGERPRAGSGPRARLPLPGRRASGRGLRDSWSSRRYRSRRPPSAFRRPRRSSRSAR